MNRIRRWQTGTKAAHTKSQQGQAGAAKAMQGQQETNVDEVQDQQQKFGP